MATWEDGPEYAPLERPDAFADPSAATVGSMPRPAPAPPPAPIERPAFADPGQPVPPSPPWLPAPPAAAGPERALRRRRQHLMTAETSAWASAHFPSAPAGPTATGQHPPTTPRCTRPRTTRSSLRDGASLRGDAYGSGAPSTSQAVVNGQRPTAAHERPPTTGPGLDSSAPGATSPGYPPPAGAPAYPAPTPPPTTRHRATLPPATRRSRTRHRGGRGVGPRPAVPAAGSAPATGRSRPPAQRSGSVPAPTSSRRPHPRRRRRARCSPRPPRAS